MRKETGESIRMEEVIDKMAEALNENKGAGCPLLFYPPVQDLIPRANNQDVVYWAQVDLRYDLEYIWKLQENDADEEQYIFIKLILPLESQKECAKYLISQQITHNYLFAK